MIQFGKKKKPSARRSNRAVVDPSVIRRGSINAALIAAGIAICIIFNLVVAQLPSNITEIDLSSEQIYTVSDTSVDFLADLEDTIVIVALLQDTDMDSRISKFLDNYCALSSNLSWQQIDPVKYPSALTTYDASEGDFVVYDKTTGQSEIVDYYDILVPDYYYYYYYGSLYYTEFDAEGQFTSAINRLTSDAIKLLYLTEGHGESSFSSDLTTLLGKSQMTTDTVNLLTAGEIPEDCDELVIYGPTSDFGQDELDLIEEYLNAGGTVTILLNDSGTDTPNLDAFLAVYGIDVAEGYIGEVTQGYYYQYYGIYAIFPALSTSVSGVTSSLSSDATVLLYGARGFTLSDPERDTISQTTFMTTSSGAYAITTDADGNTQTEEGKYILGVIATESVDDDLTARLTVYSTDSIIDSSVVAVSSSLANQTLFVNSLTAGFDDLENLSIASKSLEMDYNTIQNTQSLSAIFVVIIPLGIVVTGLIVWLMRRRK